MPVSIPRLDLKSKSINAKKQKSEDKSGNSAGSRLLHLKNEQIQIQSPGRQGTGSRQGRQTDRVIHRLYQITQQEVPVFRTV